jgi:hypothetical protein
MADNTIIQQGRFTSTGESQVLSIRSDFDWIRVYNLTAADQAAADLGYEFYFQRGMTDGRGLVWSKLGTVANEPVTIGQIAANAGFFMLDSSDQSPNAAVAITAGSNAAQPVYSTADTSGLSTGSIVRLSQLTGQEQLAGVDFEIDNVIASTSFRIRWALDSAPGAAATAGFYRIIPFDPIYYPRRRYIAAITNAAQAVVTLTVTHGYTVGQQVRFVVPEEFGMIEMNGLQGTITAVSAVNNTITVDIDSSAFTAFDIPAAGDIPLTWAQVVPFGEDTAQALSSAVDILADATRNTGFIGVRLVAGNNSPAGNANDEIYWVAGKSFSVDNQ